MRSKIELIPKAVEGFEIISGGAHNDCGHPAPEIQVNLRTRGANINRTDMGGTVPITRIQRQFSPY